MLGHDSRLGQVFNNLIDNALSFSPPEGSVRIRAWREPTTICVTVDDDGPGIRADNIESIFERFYTDRPEADEFGQNSGLGLAITRQIVEAHRGTIRAENRKRADGSVEGARFTVILPGPTLKKRCRRRSTATAVLVGADGVLIRGDSGAGKSALALALIERGAKAHRRRPAHALGRARPHRRHGAARRSLGMIELRGRGVISVPHERARRDPARRRHRRARKGWKGCRSHTNYRRRSLGIALPRQPVPAATDRAVRLVEAALDALDIAPR